MIKRDDWRLMGQEEYLMGKRLLHMYWNQPSPTWDHDHCEFCGEKLCRVTDLGYCTNERQYWICELCFDDFKAIFQWETIETPEFPGVSSAEFPLQKPPALIQDSLYQCLVKRELEWRGRLERQSDIKLFDNMRSEINRLGYEYKLRIDFMQQYITIPDVLEVIVKYLREFTDPEITADLVSAIGTQGNQLATEGIIDVYNKSSLAIREMYAVLFDNAIVRLGDKRYIDAYLKWLSDFQNATLLPSTMQMLAWWKIPEAKQWFLKYLNIAGEDEITFISIKALSYYNDEQARGKIASMQNCKSKKISEFSKSVLKKIK